MKEKHYFYTALDETTIRKNADMEKGYRPLLDAVEQALGRSLSSTSDFEYLSYQVFEKTRERLSTSTLMRLWGRRASVSPRKSTLDILARFLGYKDSADFFSSEKEDQTEKEEKEAQSEKDTSEEAKEPDETATFEQKKRAAGWWVAGVIAVLLMAAGAVYLLLNKEREPHRILAVDEITNTKMYRISSRKGLRGELGINNHRLATTYELAHDKRCLEPSEFAILQYEGDYYLYSVSDKRFINFIGEFVDAPVASSGTHLLLTPRNSCFVFSFEWSGVTTTLNMNEGNGTACTDYGIATGDFDDGNLLELYEVGDFDPTEALKTMKQMRAEYEKAAQTLVAEQTYCIYTLQDAQGRDGKRKHYLAANGRLTDTFSDSCRFVLHGIQGDTLYASPSFRVCFHAAGLGIPQGCLRAFGTIRYGNEHRDNYRGYLESAKFSNNNYAHCQAFFLGSNGCYAIRCTNAPVSNQFAGAFWCVVDADGDGSPDIDYSAERQYIWHVEPSDRNVAEGM
ncbi:MAG: hypothetical protein IJ659_09270 [Alloprevotella sp.]|nr:hypothetical protein [Alloprevotella sp.]MBR1594943.1 hypothetical protein [Alloprevotella sp.]